VSYDRGVAIRNISNVVAKAIRTSTRFNYIRKYTRVSKNGKKVELKFLGLHSQSAFSFLEETFPLACVRYNTGMYSYKYNCGWKGIPSIVIDVTPYIDIK
jgi:hypothetical protein